VPAERTDRGPVDPVDIGRVVVPVDGSPCAERALPVAVWAAHALGAEIHLIEVVSGARDTASAIRYLDGLTRRHAVLSWDIARGDDVGDTIVAATRGEPPGLACLATHGRDRRATVLGSTASAVLDRATDPVILVGPQARPPRAGDAPVVVAVDGAATDHALVDIAQGWATRLGNRLVIATVAEPVPPSFREGQPLHRAHGPADPEGYVADLAARAADASCTVDTRVAYDPTSVRDGLVRLVDRTAALLVVGSHRRTRPLRALLGSHTPRIVHDIDVPALVVPLDAGK
jgi:nucleotide-binding universal stress UspA family protein